MPFIDLEPDPKGEAYDTGDAEIDLVHYKYTRVLVDLLPPGRAFTRRAGSGAPLDPPAADAPFLRKLLAGLGMEFSRFQRGIMRMLKEADPRTATKALPWWETLLGLPDCEEPTTLAGRRLVAAAKLAAAAGHTQEIGWWEALFEGLGYELVNVDNFGDYVAACDDDCMVGLFDEEWFFLVWLYAVHGDNDELLACQVAAEQLLGFSVVLHWMWDLVDASAVALLAVATSQNGWTVAVGGGGEILRSKEFLTAWTPITPPDLFDLFAVTCAGGAVLVAVGAGDGCTRSIDGGETWTTVTIAASELYGVTRGYEDDDTVVAVGEGGEIWKSVDGGASWTAETSPTVQTLLAVTCATDVLVAVGNTGTILRSVDLGETWTEETSGTTVPLRGVAGWEDVIVVVGNTGTILRSVDLGETWTPVDSGTTDDLFAVVASPSGRWTACGATGRICQSLDAGLTWTTTEVATGNLYGAGYSALLGRAVLVGDDTNIVLE